MRRRWRTRATKEGEEETRTRWRVVVARSSTSLARSRPSAAVVPRVNSTAAVARVNPRKQSRHHPLAYRSVVRSHRGQASAVDSARHVCRPPLAGHYATTRTLCIPSYVCTPLCRDIEVHMLARVSRELAPA